MQTPQQLVEQAKQTIQQISVNDAAQQLTANNDITVIDVREAEEFSQGHLQGATNIPRGVLEFQIGDHFADIKTPIVVYCKTGGRAALSAQALQTLGYQNVSSIEGGFEAWTAQGQPTVKPDNVNYY